MKFAAQHVARAILVAISFVRHSKPLPIAEIGVEKAEIRVEKAEKTDCHFLGTLKLHAYLKPGILTL